MNVPGVTILPDTNNHFNGKNYASWKLQISELLKGKGLSGYIDGSITCPPIPVSATGAPPPDPVLTPIYSSIPSCNKWKFCDQLTHLHIVLNIIDLIGLEIKTNRTVKKC
ncbi:hypothetical protein ARMGADRAFT_929109 [Armillaria gallica]|uniref:Retrotransposon Copia-like N-terminal domain-containing protein n=1 Tax=Armillaria gallica TaxID=47427 RepID=A0A2H3DI66_ARMGA|nr:hypothetical protein ARMGADRAFT_929109 [Armillaria gallica]